MEIVIVVILGLALTSLLTTGLESCFSWLATRVQRPFPSPTPKVMGNGLLQQWTQTIQKSPGDAEAYFQRGLVYFQQGNERLAIQDYTRSLQLNQHSGTVHFHRGLAYYALGQLPAAIQDFDRSIQLDATHGQTYYQRGVAYYTLEKIPEAIENFQQAAEIFLAQGNLTDYQRMQSLVDRLVQG